MMHIGVAPHNKVEVFLFAVTHEVLKFLRQRGILGVVRQVCRAYDKASLCPFLIIVDGNCYQVPTRESW
jgi:hypothetical protein